jgi:hypothetical protein
MKSDRDAEEEAGGNDKKTEFFHQLLSHLGESRYDSVTARRLDKVELSASPRSDITAQT